MVRRCRESSFGIARAGETGEEETTAQTGEDESPSETGGEETSVAVAVEEKPPKKPIVKLGDIMGVISRIFFTDFYTGP